MAETTVKALYTAEVLGLATALSKFPLQPAHPFTASARSATCGSTVTISLGLENGTISAVGLRAQACAIGQAAAAIFARAAIGRSLGDILAADQSVELWLTDGGPIPDWPGIDAIAAAAGYPARHGAIRLPWKAALAALPSV